MPPKLNHTQKHVKHSIRALIPTVALSILIFISWASYTSPEEHVNVLGKPRSILASQSQNGNTTDPDPDCENIWKQKGVSVCEYYINGCTGLHGDIALVDYPYSYFCSTPSFRWLIMVLFVVWLFLLFYLMSSTADLYLSQTLTIISHKLNLSHNVAGVTFLALGNGAPDLFSLFAATSQQATGIGFGALIGAGVFVVAAVVGVVALIVPVRVTRRPFARDCISYVIASVCLIVIISHGTMHLWMAIGFLVFYVIYVMIVIVGRAIYQKYRTKIQHKHQISQMPTQLVHELGEPRRHEPVVWKNAMKSALKLLGDSFGAFGAVSSQLQAGSERSLLSEDQPHEGLLAAFFTRVEDTGDGEGEGKKEASTDTNTDRERTLHLMRSHSRYGSMMDRKSGLAELVDVADDGDGEHFRGHPDVNIDIEGTLINDEDESDSDSESLSVNAKSNRNVPEMPPGLHEWKEEDFNVNPEPHWHHDGDWPQRRRHSTGRSRGKSGGDGDGDSNSEKTPLLGHGGIGSIQDPTSKSSGDSKSKSKLKSKLKTLWRRALASLGDTVWDRVLSVLYGPFTLLFRLTIPVTECYRFNRVIFICNPPFTLFFFAWVVMGVDGLGSSIYSSSPIQWWVVVLVISILIMIGSFFVTRNLPDLEEYPGGEIDADSDESPLSKAVELTAVLWAFMICVVWIYLFANEMVALLHSLGVILTVSQAILGLTVLAWANSVGDLVADVAVAKQGLGGMGVGGAIGGPLMNMIVGVGVSFTFVCFKNGPQELSGGAELYVAFGGLLLSLLALLVYVPWNGFRLSRLFGASLIVLYGVVLIFTFLLEFKIILW